MAGVKPRNNRDSSRPKLIAVTVLMGLAWATLWVRAGYLQLVEGERLASMASRQHLAAEFEGGKRGRILDRNGRALAISVESQSVYARPLQVEDAARAAAKLSSILDLPARKIRHLLSSRTNFVWIERQVGDKVAARIKDAGLEGVYLTTEYSRFYPNKHLAGQLIGFVGLDGVGLEGVERRFEDRLKGRKAQFVAQRDASGRKLYLDAQGREMNLDGKDVTLTIDARIQASCEDALERTLREHGGRAATALVVDVPSGEILAWVDYPFFNPNTYRRSSPSRWRDRAALDAFEPGSTMKPFLYAAAVQEGVTDDSKLIDCEGGVYKINGQPIRDTHPRRWLSARNALRYSSNIGMAKIGMELGAPIFHRYLTDLGFGRRPALSLPGLGQGLLRPAAKWNQIDLAAASFGQGVGVTAVQMAQAYLCLGNFGVRKPLRVVHDPARVPEEDESGRRIYSEDVVRQVLGVMFEVVEREDGTGHEAYIPGLHIAGKTGTAQKASASGGYGDDHIASFAALIPAEKPELLVLAEVDSPVDKFYGGVVAAPAVREMTLRTLAYLGRPAPSPGDAALAAGGEPAESWRRKAVAAAPNAQSGKDGATPNLTGMQVRRAVEILAKNGIIPLIKGSGPLVARQTPEPGASLPDAKGVTLWLAQGQDRG
ncbi:MAG: penicillin-binding transpeptidase domain-containing protein [Desulfovibrionaceae bacterium]